MIALWLKYMEEALNEVGIEDEPKAMISDFLIHTAYFLQNQD
jgi:truncated hemoglobin YjbI